MHKKNGCAAADDSVHTIDGTVEGLNGWIVCYEKSRLVKTVFAGGATMPQKAAGSKALAQAYEAGKTVSNLRGLIRRLPCSLNCRIPASNS